MDLSKRAGRSFAEYFKGEPSHIVRAPGRVNIIGEHTDYNDGFVLPMAIDRAVWIALRPRADHIVRVRSLDFGETIEFSLGDLRRGKGWPEYLKGVAYELRLEGLELAGWDGTLVGDVPRGAGLSSSAALEMAAVRAFSVISDLNLEPVLMAQIGMRAENRWIGVSTGIMDQMASITARDGYALFLDCRSLHYQHIPLPNGVSVIVMDTSTRRTLVDSLYDERRQACIQAAQFFGAKALRDVSLLQLESEGLKLNETVRKRARHVITENQRVLDAVVAMRRKDLSALGRLLNESHVSLRDDFEVTNDALDQIVESAQIQEGCYGSRMTGAGFGGCAIALVDEVQVDDFVANVTKRYQVMTGLSPAFHLSS